MAPLWLILRARDEADALAAELVAQGVAARGIAALEREALPVDAALHAKVRDAQSHHRPAWCLLTSAFAAPILARDAVLRTLPVGALTPTTAAAARAEGLDVRLESDGGWVDLAAACTRRLAAEGIRQALVIHPTSDEALHQRAHHEEDHALRACAELVEVACYATRPAPSLARQLRDARVDDAHYVLTSPSGVRALASVEHPRATLALCRGRSTAAAWDAAFPAGPRATLAPRNVSLATTICALTASSPSLSPPRSP